MTDNYIDITVGEQTHRIQIKHEDRPCDAYVGLDGRQIVTKLKMMPYGGGAHFFEIEGHPVVLLISRSGAESDWEYDCFVDDRSVVNGKPFRYGKTDAVGLKNWEKSRRGGFLNYLVLSCSKGALIGCGVFLLLYVGGWVGRMNITLLHLLVSVLPLTALFAAFVPAEWKQNEQAYKEYLEQGEAESAPEEEPITEEPTIEE